MLATPICAEQVMNTNGNWTDGFVALAVFMMMISAQCQCWSLKRKSAAVVVQQHQPIGGPISLLPYLSVVIGYAILVLARGEDSESVGDLIIGAVELTALVLARQVVAVRENSRLLATMATRQTEARFSSLIQNSSDMITITDSSGVILYQTPSVKRMFGFEQAELVGSKLIDLVHPQDVGRTLEYLGEVASRVSVSPPIEWRLLHRDDKWRYVEAAGTNLLEDANVKGLVFNIRDITDRKIRRSVDTPGLSRFVDRGSWQIEARSEIECSTLCPASAGTGTGRGS